MGKDGNRQPESPTLSVLERMAAESGPVTQAELSYLRYLAREYAADVDRRRLRIGLIMYTCGFAIGPRFS